MQIMASLLSFLGPIVDFLWLLFMKHYIKGVLYATIFAQTIIKVDVRIYKLYL